MKKHCYIRQSFVNNCGDQAKGVPLQKLKIPIILELIRHSLYFVSYPKFKPLQPLLNTTQKSIIFIGSAITYFTTYPWLH